MMHNRLDQRNSKQGAILRRRLSVVTQLAAASLILVAVGFFLFINGSASQNSNGYNQWQQGRGLSNEDAAAARTTGSDDINNGKGGKYSSGNNPTDLSSLRIVAFGSSRTWGAGLPDRQHQTYLKQVSRSATNFAIRETGPDVPALCTYTMLGEEQIYDVIILEFVPRSQKENVWLGRLALRLRARFPHALFLFIRFHLLSGYRHSSGVSAFDWLTKERHLSSLWNTEAMEEDLLTHSQPSDWEYTPDNPQETRYLEQNEIIASVNGILLEFPSRRHQLVDPRQDFLHHALLYGKQDWQHPSIQGHQLLAEEVREILSNFAVAQNPFFNKFRNDVGPWLGGKDRCDNWFSQQTEIASWTNGNATLNHDPRMTMNVFFRKANTQKSALEVPPDGGYIEIINDIGIPAELYVSHMAVGPAPNPMYPKTQVTIDGIPDIVVHLVPEMPSNANIHIQVSAFIGIIPPGNHILRLQPLEEKEKPFRLTGIIVSPPKDFIASDNKQPEF